MINQQKWNVALAMVLFGAVASGGPIAYVLNGNAQFGLVDLTTGAFNQIGPNIPEGVGGLAPGPGGSLFTLAFSGNLDAINPATGALTTIGATGLADCSTAASPCGPTSANGLTSLNGTLYATDFQNNLYSVDPVTGHATLIGPTGIPPLTFIPFSSPNPDGSFNFYGEALFGAGGNLYATFDTGTVNFATGVVTPLTDNHLYQIDSKTGVTTLIGPTTFALESVVSINGTFYGFKNNTNQVLTLDVANGNTTLVTALDPAAGLIFGVAAVPEPASIAFTMLGLAALCMFRSRIRS